MPLLNILVENLVKHRLLPHHDEIEVAQEGLQDTLQLRPPRSRYAHERPIAAHRFSVGLVSARHRPAVLIVKTHGGPDVLGNPVNHDVGKQIVPRVHGLNVAVCRVTPESGKSSIVVHGTGRQPRGISASLFFSERGGS